MNAHLYSQKYLSPEIPCFFFRSFLRLFSFLSLVSTKSPRPCLAQNITPSLSPSFFPLPPPCRSLSPSSLSLLVLLLLDLCCTPSFIYFLLPLSRIQGVNDNMASRAPATVPKILLLLTLPFVSHFCYCLLKAQ
ncbi:MAG: hypothetical protein JOS17DRAFT_757240 [Linnemannia elongata]|nr:MAG: hypothetical protein JOS17DRAFT_757240 [Linnemannia elongata]